MRFSGSQRQSSTPCAKMEKLPVEKHRQDVASRLLVLSQAVDAGGLPRSAALDTDLLHQPGYYNAQPLET